VCSSQLARISSRDNVPYVDDSSIHACVKQYHGLLCMSTDDFTHNDVLALIEHLCVD